MCFVYVNSFCYTRAFAVWYVGIWVFTKSNIYLYVSNTWACPDSWDRNFCHASYSTVSRPDASIFIISDFWSINNSIELCIVYCILYARYVACPVLRKNGHCGKSQIGKITKNVVPVRSYSIIFTYYTALRLPCSFSPLYYAYDIKLWFWGASRGYLVFDFMLFLLCLAKYTC